MKILYIITQGHWGGAQKYTFDLATAIKERGGVVSVAIGRQRHEHDLQSQLMEIGIQVHCLRHLIRPISPLHDLFAIFELRRLVKSWRPDIVHLNSTKAGIVGSFCGAKKIIYTAHGWVFLEPMSPWKKKLYEFLEWATAKLKDEIIVITSRDMKEGERIGIPRKKMFLIHNGI